MPAAAVLAVVGLLSRLRISRHYGGYSGGSGLGQSFSRGVAHGAGFAIGSHLARAIPIGLLVLVAIVVVIVVIARRRRRY